MTHHMLAILGRFAAATAVVGIGVSSVAPRAAFATTVTTKASASDTSCTVTGSVNFGSLAVKIKSTTTYNNTEAAGATESFSGSEKMILPLQFDEAAYGYGARSFTSSISQAWIDSSDANPTSYNLAGAGVNGPATNIMNNTEIKIKLHSSAEGPFTMGSAGTDTVTLGDPTNGSWTFTMTFYSGSNGTGTVLGTEDFACSAPSSPVTVASITVT